MMQTGIYRIATLIIKKPDWINTLYLNLPFSQVYLAQAWLYKQFTLFRVNEGINRLVLGRSLGYIIFIIFVVSTLDISVFSVNKEFQLEISALKLKPETMETDIPFL